MRKESAERDAENIEEGIIRGEVTRGKEWKESRPALKSCPSSSSGEKVIKRVMEYTSGGGWDPEATPPSWGPLLLP